MAVNTIDKLQFLSLIYDNGFVNIDGSLQKDGQKLKKKY